LRSGDEPPPPEPSPSIEQPQADEAGSTPGDEQPPTEILSVSIERDGMAVSNISMEEGERIILRAIIDPFIADADIIWSSSDTRVINIDANRADMSSVTIEGVYAGSTVLKVTAGNVAQTCNITVSAAVTPALPAPPPSVPPSGARLRQLYDAVNTDNVEADLIISWTSGDFSGRQTIFEIVGNNKIWMMHARDPDSNRPYRETEPDFRYEDGAITIRFPLTTRRIYYLFEDGTGYYILPDGTERENLTWALVT